MIRPILSTFAYENENKLRSVSNALDDKDKEENWDDENTFLKTAQQREYFAELADY